MGYTVLHATRVDTRQNKIDDMARETNDNEEYLRQIYSSYVMRRNAVDVL